MDSSQIAAIIYGALVIVFSIALANTTHPQTKTIQVVLISILAFALTLGTVINYYEYHKLKAQKGCETYRPTDVVQEGDTLYKKIH